MSNAAKILSVEPRYAIPGGEITIECEDNRVSFDGRSGVLIDGVECRLTAASSNRILAIIPDGTDGGHVQLELLSDGMKSEPYSVVIGKQIASEMHMVANPAIDPSDDAIILTRSGSRGQQLPVTLFRLETDGYLDEMNEAVLNPTGIAFGPDGDMYVTNRAQGEVYAIDSSGSSSIYASGLGIATAIAFDRNGTMFVGDRMGTIYQVNDFADVEIFTKSEASVAAVHMAFAPDGRLFMTAPGFASKDAIHVIDVNGSSSIFYRGLGRPQGLAFDKDGALYAAACFRGRHGVVRIDPDGQSAECIVSGNGLVGLCFTRSGEMILATAETVYSLPCGIYGTLI